jgi:hypothetical protein
LVRDSDEAFLRLVARDGQHSVSAVRGPFIVDNGNESPSITLLWPQRGEVLSGASPVRWETRDPDGDAVQVELLVRQGEGSWVPMAGGLPEAGEYLWNARDFPPGEGYTLRAISRDSRGASSMDVVQNLTVAHNLPPEVALIWPRQEATLYSSTAILWRTNDPDGDRLVIDLYYSDNDGLTWYTLAQGVEDVGYYVWEVSFLPPGATYRLKVVARDAYHAGHDQSKGLITIRAEAPPGVYLLEPWAGSSVRGVTRVTWQPGYPTNEQTYADLLMRAAGDTEWRPLATGLRGTRSYLWDTTRHADGLYDLVVRLRRGDERSVSNVMTQVRVGKDGPQPVLTVDAPACGDLLAGWQVVRWTGPDARYSGPALLEASPDAGVTWTVLATVPSGDRRYLWDTDAWPAGAGYMLRLTITGSDNQQHAALAGPFALGGRGLWPPRLEASAAFGTSTAGARVTWSAQDADGDSLALTLALCSVAGTHCSPVPGDLAASGEHMPDERAARTGGGLARVVASDGIYRVEGIARWEAIESQGERMELTLLAPTGEREMSGSVPITWEARAVDGDAVAIDIAYSADGGQTWMGIIEDLENVGRYLWQTALVANGTYRVRVTSRSGERAVSRQSQPFVLNRPGRNAPLASLVVDADALGQTGSRALVWQASDADRGASLARIEYSLGVTGTWNVLSEELYTRALAGWSGMALPNAPVWLRLVAYDGTLERVTIPVGPVVIQHGAAPRVHLVSPVGGECWPGPQAVAWAATGGSGALMVALELSLDAGLSWDTLASGLPAVGSYTWDAGSVPEWSEVLFRAVARSGDTLGVAQSADPITTLSAAGRQPTEGDSP